MTKTALVTGGSRGIGKCVVDLLRAKGWEVIAPTRAELDMSSPRESVTDYGGLMNDRPEINAVVFCHGEWYSRPLTEQYATHYYKQYESRVISCMELLHWTLWLLEKSKACVVAVSSTRGFIGGVDTGPYSAACAAQIALMQGYAREYQGVRFNCVAPGLTNTDMGQDVIKTGGAKPGAPMQPPEVVAAEIVRLIESEDNGRVMRVVDSKVTEAKWTW